jgi:hypothetical protein
VGVRRPPPLRGYEGVRSPAIPLSQTVGVPRVEHIGPDEFLASYWSAPMLRPGDLCDPMRLASMLTVAPDALTNGDE